MNILPKKRWHVRTKENIARVRKDEAKAAEEEKAREQRAKLAEQEARTEALRVKARTVYDGRPDQEEVVTTPTNSKGEHVNFFQELEDGLVAFTGNNKDYEREKKEEKEKYEKQIGYLTYLGQDTVEATGNISWYNKVPSRLLPDEAKKEEVKEKEVNVKSKLLVDPLNSIRRYLGMESTSKNNEAKQNLPAQTKNKMNYKRKRDESSDSEESKRSKHKRKKAKKHKCSHSKDKSFSKKKRRRTKSESSINNQPEVKADLDELRAKRLQRERAEKLRAEKVLAKLRGETLPEDKPVVPTVQQKYSSQFNPHLAKQNFETERRYTRH
uniref:CBF1-interacting co-repressor CIR N-terminal domain-containing protein n=1 Tax=Graphocephala atropunctata TaxID=36148 RepID=A0A1B6M703_9HEMI